MCMYVYKCIYVCLFVSTSDHVQTFELQFGLCKFARKCAFIAVHCGIIANYSRQHSMTGITFNKRQQITTTSVARKTKRLSQQAKLILIYTVK